MKTRKKYSSLLMASGLVACLAICYGAYMGFFSKRGGDNIVGVKGGFSLNADSNDKMPEQGDKGAAEVKGGVSVGYPAEVADPVAESELTAEKVKGSKKKNISQSDNLIFLTSGDEQVVMTESQLVALHKKQQAEAEAALPADEIVVSEGEGGGLTTLQLKALHDEQEAEFENQTDETLALLTDDGTALTVSQLKALHEEQEKEISSLNEIAAVSSNDNDAIMTAGELKALHELQEAELDATRDLQPIEVAPAQDGQGPTILTAQELRILHAQQSE